MKGTLILNESTFIDKLKLQKNFSDHLKSIAEKIQSHDLPIIIFGATHLAEQVTSALKSLGVVIGGYAVDSKYYKGNSTFLGLPVFNFDELRKTPEKFVFVPAVGAGRSGWKRHTDFLKDEDIIQYDTKILCSMCSLNRNYVIENQKQFVETYNLLADNFSKKTMLSYLNSHITGETFDDIVCNNPYFNKLTSPTLHKNGGGVRGLRRVQRRYLAKFYTICQW